MSYYLIEIKQLLVELETSNDKKFIIDKINEYIKLLEENSDSFVYSKNKMDK